jgi:NAD(P)-dependent dehydrogenase (short-subunit alcohol dehydrogenase family)
MATEQRIALVVGGTSGIGKAAAAGLAARGFQVWIVGSDQARGAEAQAAIRAQAGHDRVDFLCHDVATRAGWEGVVADVQGRTEHVDAIVNSTGVIRRQPQRTADGLDDMFTINLVSRIGIIRGLLPALERSGDARVVLVGSRIPQSYRLDLAAVRGEPPTSSLRRIPHLQRAAQVLMYSLARQHPGITFNVIHPGFVKTNVYRELPRWLMWIVGTMTLLFAVAPDQAAENAVRLVADPEARSINGQLFMNPRSFEQRVTLEVEAETERTVWALVEQALTGSAPG